MKYTCNTIERDEMFTKQYKKQHWLRIVPFAGFYFILSALLGISFQRRTLCYYVDIQYVRIRTKQTNSMV